VAVRVTSTAVFVGEREPCTAARLVPLISHGPHRPPAQQDDAGEVAAAASARQQHPSSVAQLLSAVSAWAERSTPARAVRLTLMMWQGRWMDGGDVCACMRAQRDRVATYACQPTRCVKTTHN